MYKLTGIDSLTGDPFNTIIRKSDNASIPMDENNRDYQEYLAWLAEGNEPEEAE